jgi:hypothetical protein
MAAKRDKISIEVIGPSDDRTVDRALNRSQDAVLALARLLGRQIARERFEPSRNQAPRTDGPGDPM